MKVVQFQIVSGTLYRLYEDGTITSCYQGDAGIVETAEYPIKAGKQPVFFPMRDEKPGGATQEKRDA